MPRANRARFAFGSGLLTITDDVFEIGKDDADPQTEPNSDDVPAVVYIDSVRFKVSSIVTAVDITWRICADLLGDFALTPPLTQTIQPGDDTATNGGISALIESEFPDHSDRVSKKLYVVASVDAGTATLDGCYINFRR